MCVWGGRGCALIRCRTHSFITNFSLLAWNQMLWILSIFLFFFKKQLMRWCKESKYIQQLLRIILMISYNYQAMSCYALKKKEKRRNRKYCEIWCRLVSVYGDVNWKLSKFSDFGYMLVSLTPHCTICNTWLLNFFRLSFKIWSSGSLKLPLTELCWVRCYLVSTAAKFETKYQPKLLINKVKIKLAYCVIW